MSTEVTICHVWIQRKHKVRLESRRLLFLVLIPTFWITSRKTPDPSFAVNAMCTRSSGAAGSPITEGLGSEINKRSKLSVIHPARSSCDQTRHCSDTIIRVLSIPPCRQTLLAEGTTCGDHTPRETGPVAPRPAVVHSQLVHSHRVHSRGRFVPLAGRARRGWSGGQWTGDPSCQRAGDTASAETQTAV